MKAWKFTVMPVLLALALMVSMAPVSLAEALCADAQRGYLSMEDYTKVRWFAESEGFEANENSAPFEDAHLEIDAVPGSEWALSADFVKIRDSRLVPYRGQLEVTGWCEWSSDALVVADRRVVMPEAEGVYALTGRFTDDEGNDYSVEMVFNVSGSNEVERVLPKSGGATTVEGKVQELAAQCRALNYKTEYEIALWMHDWLIYNATYDYSENGNHDAAGVLLYGTGVCDSYSRAYGLLLDAFGIENHRVVSDAIDHAWNIARLDGVWCYVDCTWDDPGTGGEENHTYFGMSTALITRDHVIEDSQPAANSLANYYPLREGLACYAAPEELDAVLAPLVSAQQKNIEVFYIGTEAKSRIYNDVKTWLAEKGSTYGIRGYGMSYGKYRLMLKNLSYSEPVEPVEQPEKHLPEPVDAPDFDLESPNGQYLLQNYRSNGLVLIFGRTTCSNTQALLRSLSPSLSGLYDSGVEVLVSLAGLQTPQNVEAMEKQYPGYHYAYASDIFWNYLSAIGYDTTTSVTFPCVFVLNRDAKVIYYSTGYVGNVPELVSEARSVATGKPLPDPVTHTDLDPMLNGSGNINSIENGKTIVTAAQSAASRGMVLLVVSNTPNKSFLEYCESHYRLFDRLGISLVASFSAIADGDKALYPHCNIVDYSEDDFWPLLRAANYTESSAYLLTSMLVEKGGDIVAFTNGDLLKPERCALYAARKLKYDATAPAGLEVIDAEAFSGAAFRRLDLTNGSLTEIADGAFAGCNALEFVRIPETVTAIGDDAFTNKDTVILCVVGSAAHKYAIRNGFQYLCD